MRVNEVEIIAEQRFTRHQGHHLLALKLRQRGHACGGCQPTAD
jgi:hypothetical protein